MKAVLLLIFFLLILSLSVNAEKFYSIHLTNTDKGLAYSGTTIVNGIPPSSQIGEYTATVIGFSGEPLFVQQFTPPQGTFDLKLAYFQNGKEVRIEKEGPLFSFPVNQFANTCGNNLCEPQENNLLCPNDCPKERESQTSVSNNTICNNCSMPVQPEVNPQKTLPKEPLLKEISPDFSASSLEQPLPRAWYIPMILLPLLFLLLFFIWWDRRRHNQKIIAQLQNYINTYLQQGYLPEQIRPVLINNGYRKKDIDAVFSAIKLTTPPPPEVE